ncbi:MAG: NifU family protein [Chloroflexi bacterium]|jgi:Fe-S cluster biogenesis protein NfuA|nr:NifU family protein [Chloroflexota bacterium]MBT3670088.1 NifU family protein [Chloroflexota bacterium]MBT4002300.1 NifU family protein [Chloroflexota bacterium]MBT4306710.1 NifU family protein [Chloroflexota bacterium]MBT4532974.1 NifU family protein [Chloroflexota bacterium]
MTDHSHAVASDEEKMTALLERVSAYIEQFHGGYVQFVSFEDNIVKVKMGGACDGCSLTETTLQGWIAGTIRQFFPDVEEIIAV